MTVGRAYDYDAWARRAADFTRRLAEWPGAEVRSAELGVPLAALEVDRIERALGRQLPAALRGLLEQGTGTLDCQYIFEPEPEGDEWDRFAELFPDQTYIYGGARVIADELPDLVQRCAEWVRETWVGDDPIQRALWEGALPIVRIDNGDFLALDLRTATSDPPVLYLAHDDESVSLSPSLTRFLAAWEGLCYVGPEIWLLESFRDADGRLNGEGERAEALQALLAVPHDAV